MVNLYKKWLDTELKVDTQEIDTRLKIKIEYVNHPKKETSTYVFEACENNKNRKNFKSLEWWKTKEKMLVKLTF